MRPEEVTDPAIEGEVKWGRLQVRTVIDRGRVLVIASRRLDPDENVTEEETRNGKATGVKLRRRLRIAPASDHAAARGRRKIREPGVILRLRYPAATARMSVQGSKLRILDRRGNQFFD